MNTQRMSPSGTALQAGERIGAFTRGGFRHVGEQARFLAEVLAGTRDAFVKATSSSFASGMRTIVRFRTTDLHAVTGPGGGAAATLTMPGGESVLAFRALNPGLYVYHCAVSPVPMHIGNGMYGLILVEPKEGLPKVDREFYIMQSEFYAKAGKAGQPHTLDMEKGMAEQPTHVVFNGSVGAMTGDKALEAKAGESVRLFVGNAGPNLVSSFHVIGEIFDNVYGEGGSLVSQKNVQTTLVPAGGAAIVEFRAEKPGTLVVVDHSIFRAFNKGALGMINVTGADTPEIYKQLKGLGMAKH